MIHVFLWGYFPFLFYFTVDWCLILKQFECKTLNLQALSIIMPGIDRVTAKQFGFFPPVLELTIDM